MVDLVKTKGVKGTETKGDLRKYLERKERETEEGGNVETYVHGEYCFIIADGKLITVYLMPSFLRGKNGSR